MFSIYYVNAEVNPPCPNAGARRRFVGRGGRHGEYTLVGLTPLSPQLGNYSETLPFASSCASITNCARFFRLANKILRQQNPPVSALKVLNRFGPPR
jgi:hypothetical protein